jgi:integrase
VALRPTAQAHVGAATLNRKLSALAAFYAHQARQGADVGELLTTWAPGRRGGWKPFLHHVSKNKAHARRVIKVRSAKKLPRVLTVAEMQAILDACTRLRDRFLWALLVERPGRAGSLCRDARPAPGN